MLEIRKAMWKYCKFSLVAKLSNLENIEIQIEPLKLSHTVMAFKKVTDDSNKV